MYFEEKRILREVNWAGFGFQAWLQIQTHLRRSGQNSILVIDEPDVYLHPDLQKKLVSDIRKTFPQYIIATHAVEIINEAEASEIVAVNNNYQQARRIRSDADYRSIFRYIGSGENAAFARLAKSKRVIFVEGEDEKYIRKLATKLKMSHLADPQNVPIVRLGGFSEWKRATATAWSIRNIMDIDIQITCIFDRDYRCDEEVQKFLAEIEEKEIKCFVLSKKEIENFFLIPEVMHRAVLSRIRARQADPDFFSEAALIQLLEAVIADLWDKASSQISAHRISHIKSVNPKLDISNIITENNTALSNARKSMLKSLSLVSGKEALTVFNQKLRDSFSVNITEFQIIDLIDERVIDRDFLSIMQNLNKFCALKD